MRGKPPWHRVWFFSTLVLASTLGVIPAQPQTPTSSPSIGLIWQGGEQVPGTLVGADSNGVTFHPLDASFFPTPITILPAHVEALQITHSAPPRKEPFMITLRDGGRLLADQIRLEGQTLSLHSAWLGHFKLHLCAVAELAQVRGDAIVFVSPGPGLQWAESLRLEESTNNPDLNDPFAAPAEPLKVRRVQGGRSRRNPDGSLATDGQLKLWKTLPTGGWRTESWNNTLSTALRDPSTPVLPLRLRLDFHLSANQTPAFLLKIQQGETDLRVETWDQQLVLRQGNRFAAVPAATQLTDYRFTLLWNRETHAAQLLTHSGTLLAELPAVSPSDPFLHHTRSRPAPNSPQDSSPPPAQPTFSLENLGTDLSLHSASMTVWKGGTVQAAPVGQAYARLLSGKVLVGDWLRADATGITLRTTTGTEQSAPWDEVLILVNNQAFSSQPPVAAKPSGPTIRLRSAAEESLTGTLLRIASPATITPNAPAGELQIHFLSPAAVGPWQALLSATAELEFLPSTSTLAHNPAQPYADRLTINQHTLRGDLVATGERLPHWQFVGATQSVPLPLNKPLTINRPPQTVPPEPAPSTAASASAALLQLKAGDLVPVNLTGIDSGSIRFTSPSLLRTTLAAADAAALLFPGKPLLTQGFRDPAWQQLAGDKPVLSTDQLDDITLQPGDVLGHPAMMVGDDIEFTLHENAELSPSSLNLTLYSRGLESTDDNLRVVIAFVGDELYCGEGLAEGQLRRQGQMPKPNEPIRVQISQRDTQVHVRINGGEIVSIPIANNQRLGYGLLLQAGALWGNQPQPIRLTAFSAATPTQQLRVPHVDDVVRSQALTIPRSRQDQPPQHLVIGPNGDLLRGTVETFQNQSLQLRWGLESLTIPQARIAALVMLQPPPVSQTPSPPTPPRPASPPTTPPHWLLLRDGGRFGLSLERWAEDGVVGQHPLLGRVRLPNSSILALWSGNTPPQLDASRAVSGWTLQNAAQPVIPEEAGTTSPLLGTEAKPFDLPLLSGETFRLSDHRGKVVVLDFWATWCGPCLKALPDLMAALKDFPSDQVKLVGINQAEPAETVQRFLQNRNWNLITTLDSEQIIGRQFAVETIPHTVVIAPDGKVALVKIGHTATTAKEIADQVRKSLPTK